LGDPGDKGFVPLMVPNRSVANRGSNSSIEYSGLVPGLSNTSILVATAGRVTSIGTDEFSISDGSLGARNLPIREVKVLLRDMVAPAQPPPLDSYVVVTGVSCYTMEDGMYKPAIRPRSQSDIVQVM